MVLISNLILFVFFSQILYPSQHTSHIFVLLIVPSLYNISYITSDKYLWFSLFWYVSEPTQKMQKNKLRLFLWFFIITMTSLAYSTNYRWNLLRMLSQVILCYVFVPMKVGNDVKLTMSYHLNISKSLTHRYYWIKIR